MKIKLGSILGFIDFGVKMIGCGCGQFQWFISLTGGTPLTRADTPKLIRLFTRLRS